MARLRSSRRRRRQRPPHGTARTAETANKADSIEPGRPKPAQRRARRQTQPRLPFGGWAWAPPGWVRAPAYPAGEREKTYSVSRAWASTEVPPLTGMLSSSGRRSQSDARLSKPTCLTLLVISQNYPRHGDRRLQPRAPNSVALTARIVLNFGAQTSTTVSSTPRGSATEMVATAARVHPVSRRRNRRAHGGRKSAARAMEPLARRGDGMA